MIFVLGGNEAQSTEIIAKYLLVYFDNIYEAYKTIFSRTYGSESAICVDRNRTDSSLIIIDCDPNQQSSTPRDEPIFIVSEQGSNRCGVGGLTRDFKVR